MSDDQLAIVKIESSEESKEEEDANAHIGDDHENKEDGDATKQDERDPNAEYMILHKVLQSSSPEIGPVQSSHSCFQVAQR